MGSEGGVPTLVFTGSISCILSVIGCAFGNLPVPLVNGFVGSHVGMIEEVGCIDGLLDRACNGNKQRAEGCTKVVGSGLCIDVNSVGCIQCGSIGGQGIALLKSLVEPPHRLASLELAKLSCFYVILGDDCSVGEPLSSVKCSLSTAQEHDVEQLLFGHILQCEGIGVVSGCFKSETDAVAGIA